MQFIEELKTQANSDDGVASFIRHLDATSVPLLLQQILAHKAEDKADLKRRVEAVCAFADERVRDFSLSVLGVLNGFEETAELAKGEARDKLFIAGPTLVLAKNYTEIKTGVKKDRLVKIVKDLKPTDGGEIIHLFVDKCGFDEKADDGNSIVEIILDTVEDPEVAQALAQSAFMGALPDESNSE